MAAQDRLQNSGGEFKFRQKLQLAAAVLEVPFVREIDLEAAAKTAFRGKSERRSVQHRLAGNDSFKKCRLQEGEKGPFSATIEHFGAHLS